MSIRREHIEIAAAIWERQRQLKRIHGDHYDRRMGPYREEIKKEAARGDGNELAAVLRIVKCNEDGWSGIQIAHFLAAAADLCDELERSA